MKIKKFFLLLTSIISIPLGLAIIYFSLSLLPKPKFLSPLAADGSVLSSFDLKQEEEFHVVGFLPYWNIKKWRPQIDTFDEIIFFGCEINSRGEIVKNNECLQLNSGLFKEIKTLFQKNGKKVSLALTLFDDEAIDQLINNPSSLKRLVNQTNDFVTENNFDGVNIDFEHSQNAVSLLQPDLYDFIESLKKTTNKNISVDIYSNAIIQGEKKEINKLTKYLDYLIIMAYDFHNSGSTVSGPVAPLRTKEDGKDILKTLRFALEKVPRNKIILAVPLYGYEWYTVGEEFGSTALEWPTALASYSRTKKLLENDQGLKVYWDRTSLTPWLVYKEAGSIKQIYFENLYSLSLKFDLVKQSKIGGVGFWALGYEGEYNEVWQEVKERLK